MGNNDWCRTSVLLIRRNNSNIRFPNEIWSVRKWRCYDLQTIRKLASRCSQFSAFGSYHSNHAALRSTFLFDLALQFEIFETRNLTSNGKTKFCRSEFQKTTDTISNDSELKVQRIPLSNCGSANSSFFKLFVTSNCIQRSRFRIISSNY